MKRFYKQRGVVCGKTVGSIVNVAWFGFVRMFVLPMGLE